jgi:ribose 5-phosphate isomerase A
MKGLPPGQSTRWLLIVSNPWPAAPHLDRSNSMTQDELKTMVGRAALAYVEPDTVIGVGTGSTVNKFIDALGTMARPIAGAVSSSLASTERLEALGIRVLDAAEAGELAVYIDGADEIDAAGNMVKGGGAALTREKIVAAQARRFICIADDSKLVETLGAFPLPVEIIPMAARRIAAQFAALGGHAVLRLQAGRPLVTDNGQHILDVTGLKISNPRGFESLVSQWPGVVTVGVFAFQKADVCLLGGEAGVRTLTF